VTAAKRPPRRLLSLNNGKRTFGRDPSHTQHRSQLPRSMPLGASVE
jgi:hypothetical protein